MDSGPPDAPEPTANDDDAPAAADAPPSIANDAPSAEPLSADALTATATPTDDTAAPPLGDAVLAPATGGAPAFDDVVDATTAGGETDDETVLSPPPLSATAFPVHENADAALRDEGQPPLLSATSFPVQEVAAVADATADASSAIADSSAANDAAAATAEDAVVVAAAPNNNGLSATAPQLRPQVTFSSALEQFDTNEAAQGGASSDADGDEAREAVSSTASEAEAADWSGSDDMDDALR